MSASSPEVERVNQLIALLLDKCPPATTPAKEFWATQFDMGLAWVQFPPGRGGLGLDPKFQELVDDCLDEAGAPSNVSVNFMLVGMAGPTLVAKGTDEQQDR